MHRRLATAIAWLLIVAVPVQAMAATVMVHCMSASDRSATSQTEFQHHHAASTASHTHDSVAAGAPLHSHSAMDTADAGAEDLKVDAKCSACAFCCVGGAPTSTSRSLVDFPPRELPALRPAGPLPDISVPGPERPPRFSLV
jgi:hypothetical protein